MLPVPLAPEPAPPTASGGQTSLWRELRNTFVAGVAVMLPLVITLWLISIIWNVLNSPFSSLLKTVSTWLGPESESGQLLLVLSKWPGLGILVSLSVVLLAGFLARNLLGKHFIHWVDDMAGRIPLVRAIYTSIKQVSDTVFTTAGKQAFRKAVLVRFPTAESLAIGFVTGESPAAGRGSAPGKVVNVFVPTAPNPTSGVLLMIPEEKLVPLDMSVEDAFKMVVSGGVVMPPAGPAASGAAAAPAPLPPPACPED